MYFVQSQRYAIRNSTTNYNDVNIFAIIPASMVKKPNVLNNAEMTTDAGQHLVSNNLDPTFLFLQCSAALRIMNPYFIPQSALQHVLKS